MWYASTNMEDVTFSTFKWLVWRCWLVHLHYHPVPLLYTINETALLPEPCLWIEMKLPRLISLKGTQYPMNHIACRPINPPCERDYLHTKAQSVISVIMLQVIMHHTTEEYFTVLRLWANIRQTNIGIKGWLSKYNHIHHVTTHICQDRWNWVMDD